MIALSEKHVKVYIYIYWSFVQWGQATNPNCSCGEPETMQHIVNEGPLTHFNGGLEALHLAEQDAVLWLGTQCKR